MRFHSRRAFVAAVLAVLLVGGLAFAAGFFTRPLVAAVDPTAFPTVAPTLPPPSATPVPPEPTALPTPSPVPAQPSPTAPGTAEAALETPFARFWEVWSRVTQDYYGDLPTDDEIVNGAIRGALDTLGDPFTGYIEAEAAAINRQDDTGSFEGIGAFVSMEDGQLVIVQPIKGQPAEAAGVRRGDVVLEVDGVQIENMSIYEAIGLIRGPAGTPVLLRLQRDGEDPFEVEITRARIDIPVVESELRPDGIAYARLNEFSTDSTAKLGAAIEEMLAQNPKGLILDMRGNPGGWLNEAVLTAGLFLPKGDLVLIERSKDGVPQEYTTPDDPIAPDIPMVVLVDAGSASASEIVAGALRDQGRAKLVGEKTFGKGSVQWAEELSDGAELRVTVARWFTPNDLAIHGEGLEPDIAVEITPEQLDAGEDPQLDRAVTLLLTGE
jgi:carboxyl-terminal processing protease